MLQIQARPPSKQGEAAWGAEGEAVVIYCEPLATLEMRHPRLSHWVNNIAVFTIFMISFRVNSIKADKKSGNADRYSL